MEELQGEFDWWLRALVVKANTARIKFYSNNLWQRWPPQSHVVLIFKIKKERTHTIFKVQEFKFFCLQSFQVALLLHDHRRYEKDSEQDLVLHTVPVAISFSLCLKNVWRVAWSAVCLCGLIHWWLTLLVSAMVVEKIKNQEVLQITTLFAVLLRGTRIWIWFGFTKTDKMDFSVWREKRPNENGVANSISRFYCQTISRNSP